MDLQAESRTVSLLCIAVAESCVHKSIVNTTDTQYQDHVWNTRWRTSLKLEQVKSLIKTGTLKARVKERACNGLDG